MDKQQILIVDDEEVNREILKGVFQNDYDCILVNDVRPNN